ncbi:MAG: DsrE family protein [Azoarcus sp.]|nr:DsrE family protein [Azoarcus sp.]
MYQRKSILTLFAFIFMVFSQSLFAADAGQRLFVNLTSSELNRAAMAIGFSTKVLTEKKIPVTIFLNVEGVRIADKSIPENKYVNGKSLKEMLSSFMGAGGRVIVCPMCMENVGGLLKEDLIPGVEVGGTDVTWPALFDKGTTVLSY